ncbi:MAG: metallophosphoesterase [Oscillospiraceae bacterium]|nr:metallophosphoesterase [Oscillospiraceae bacterium]
MNYAMSDLHGCYDEFLQMLEVINFSSDDNLIIIGDVVDRGPVSVKLLQNVTARKNIRLLMGNHEWFMLGTIKRLPVDVTFDNFKEYIDEEIELTNDNVNEYLTEYSYRNWIYNGGGSTFNEYLSLSVPERTDLIKFLDSLFYYYELTVENQKYMLVHSVPAGFEKEKPMEDYEPFDLLFSRIEKDEWNGNFYDDKIMIVGHTPTFFIDKKYAGKIYRKKRAINIDCGCVYKDYGGKLGCLRLEDMKEYYI